MLGAFGGVPHEILYDNMKTVVTHRDAYGEGPSTPVPGQDFLPPAVAHLSAGDHSPKLSTKPGLCRVHDYAEFAWRIAWAWAVSRCVTPHSQRVSRKARRRSGALKRTCLGARSWTRFRAASFIARSASLAIGLDQSVEGPTVVRCHRMLLRG